MRPNIPDELEAQINEVYEQAGYATPSEFVRDAVRRRVNTVRDNQNRSTPVKEMTPSAKGGIYYGVNADTDDEVRIPVDSPRLTNVRLIGDIGSGVAQMMQALLRDYAEAAGNTAVYIPLLGVTSDPDGFDVPFADVVGVGSGKGTVNPLDVSPVKTDVDAELYPVSEAVDFATRCLYETIPVDESDNGLLRQAVSDAYKDAGFGLRDPVPEDAEPPVVGDVLAVLEDYATNPKKYEPAHRDDMQSEAHELLGAMRRYRDGGALAWLNGQTEIGVQEDELTFVLQNGISDMAAQAVVVRAVYHQLRRMGSADSTLLGVDDAHGFTVGGNWLERRVRHARHGGPRFMVGSQLADEPWLQGVTDNSRTKVFLRSEMKSPLVHRYGLTEKEADEVSKFAPPSDGEVYARVRVQLDEGMGGVTVRRSIGRE